MQCPQQRGIVPFGMQPWARVGGSADSEGGHPHRASATAKKAPRNYPRKHPRKSPRKYAPECPRKYSRKYLRKHPPKYPQKSLRKHVRKYFMSFHPMTPPPPVPGTPTHMQKPLRIKIAWCPSTGLISADLFLQKTHCLQCLQYVEKLHSLAGTLICEKWMRSLLHKCFDVWCCCNNFLTMQKTQQKSTMLRQQQTNPDRRGFVCL